MHSQGKAGQQPPPAPLPTCRPPGSAAGPAAPPPRPWRPTGQPARGRRPPGWWRSPTCRRRSGWCRTAAGAGGQDTGGKADWRTARPHADSVAVVCWPPCSQLGRCGHAAAIKAWSPPSWLLGGRPTHGQSTPLHSTSPPLPTPAPPPSSPASHCRAPTHPVVHGVDRRCQLRRAQVHAAAAGRVHVVEHAHNVGGGVGHDAPRLRTGGGRAWRVSRRPAAAWLGAAVHGRRAARGGRAKPRCSPTPPPPTFLSMSMGAVHLPL